MYEDPAASSRMPIHRKGFKQLLDEAAGSDTVRVADAARRGLHLWAQCGLLSGIDLAAEDSGTTMVVNVLAAVIPWRASPRRHRPGRYSAGPPRSTRTRRTSSPPIRRNLNDRVKPSA